MKDDVVPQLSFWQWLERVSLILISLAFGYYIGGAAFEVLLGAALMIEVASIVYYLRLIRLYRYANAHPAELSGKLEMSYRFALQHRLTEILFLSGLPLVLILLYQPSFFIGGCLLGTISGSLKISWLTKGE